MQSTHIAQINIPNLPDAAKQVHLFPNLASGSLLSIGQLCNSGCTATFTKSKLYIYFEGKIILQGSRQSNNLWTINDTSSTSIPTFSLNAAVDVPTIAERIKFYHASLFSPTLDTLRKAINAGYLTSFPSFTTKQLSKFPPNSEATIKGHLHAQRANIRSTKKSYKSPHFLYNTTTIVPKPITHIIPMEDNTTITPPIPKPSPIIPNITTQKPSTNSENNSNWKEIVRKNNRTNYTYPHCIEITGQIHSDQTGQFLVPSISGNKYVFILYDYDSNFIHAEPIPSRSKHQILKAFNKITSKLSSRGLKPRLQRMDNEASQLLLDQMDEDNIDYQLTPAGLHRRNSAEKAVQTFKNHFISGLCSTNPTFPLNIWDKLIPQAVITLNLLRSSRINPQLSAYAQLYGAFDYNRTPLAPPGIKLLTHIRPENRKSWDPHAAEGFYLGPALHHYRCHRVWMTKTAAERIANTVKWLPHNSIKMPVPSRESIIIAAGKRSHCCYQVTRQQSTTSSGIHTNTYNPTTPTRYF